MTTIIGGWRKESGMKIESETLKEWIGAWFVKNKYYHPYSKENNIPIPELYDLIDRLSKYESDKKEDGNVFRVIDKKTGKEANRKRIARNLLYCDMDGFAIMEDGSLILMDECGYFRYCPEDRFEIEWGVKGCSKSLIL